MVEVTVELYAQNMEYCHDYDEIMKHFGEGGLKELALSRNIYSCMMLI